MLIDAEWLNRHLTTPTKPIGLTGYTHKDLAPRITCADGYSVSVQASETAYANPRRNYGPWWNVECGFATPPDGSPLLPADEEAVRIDAEHNARGEHTPFEIRVRAVRHLYVFVDEWAEWADGRERGGYGDTVYGYVPVEAVVAWVNAHGGVAEKEAA